MFGIRSPKALAMVILLALLVTSLVGCAPSGKEEAPVEPTPVEEAEVVEEKEPVEPTPVEEAEPEAEAEVAEE